MNSTDAVSLFVVCPKGLQYVLERELLGLGVTDTKAIPSGVHCLASIPAMYRTLLWSRVASRVILLLDTQKVESVEDIYRTTANVDWTAHFSQEHQFAVEFSGTNKNIRNTTFGALTVKDAVVDQFRKQLGNRPNVSKSNPDIRISARLSKGYLSLGIDLSGDSLHKRGYRTATGPAPLKENLAAGLLLLAGWPKDFDAEAGFVDPMCGSGTLLIEAAHMRLDKAPALARQHWGFDAWKQHDPDAWQAEIENASTRYENAKANFRGRLIGFDEDASVVHRAWLNIHEAGLEELIHVEKRALSDFKRFDKLQTGLMLTNPPYGERLGEIKALNSLYKSIGGVLFESLEDWRAGVFTGNAELGKQIGWHSYKQYKLYNGPIESQLLLFELKSGNRFKQPWQQLSERLQDPGYWKVSHEDRAKMLANRLTKNVRTIGKWAEKQGISCYRIYDADMPEFAFAIDVYTSAEGQRWLNIQEYAAPKKVDDDAALERLREGLAVIRESLDVPPEFMRLKQRSVKKGAEQYEKESNRKQFFLVNEYEAVYLVNLSDYLDTGLFLDHRPIRRWVQAHAQGKRFLNLFCYTASVSVAAALGGASESLSLDMSKTYLGWAADNYKENQVDSSRHLLQQADCLAWLKGPVEEQYDLVFLDPPSFSNSKRMEGVLDIQRDQDMLVDACMQRLAPGGTLVFSNNLRKFKLSPELESRYRVTNFTAQSIDRDFERNAKIHQCWLIQHA